MLLARLVAESVFSYFTINMSLKIHSSDFQKFDYIFAMDRDNLRDLQRLHQRHGGQAKVMLFGRFGGGKKAEEVEDPYYGGKDGFTTAYEQCLRFTKNFLKDIFPDVKA